MSNLILRFDIDGYVTGFGNPDWSRTHGAASQTSSVVSALVEGGATCTGKSVVDDMAFRFIIFNFDFPVLFSRFGLSFQFNRMKKDGQLFHA